MHSQRYVYTHHNHPPTLPTPPQTKTGILSLSFIIQCYYNLWNIGISWVLNQIILCPEEFYFYVTGNAKNIPLTWTTKEEASSLWWPLLIGRYCLINVILTQVSVIKPSQVTSQRLAYNSERERTYQAPPYKSVTIIQIFILGIHFH